MTDTPTRGNQPDLVEVIGDAILDYYGGFGQHPGVTRAYGAAEAAVAALGRRRPDLKALLDGTLTVPSLNAGSGVGGQRDTSVNPANEE